MLDPYTRKRFLLEVVMQELWKDIEGYEGIYQVSNFGRIKSCERVITTKRGLWHIKEKIIHGSVRNDGYIMVALKNNGRNKRVLVHRLVAQAFIPNPNCHPIINHKDEVRSNNVVDNLEWCTNEYNLNYGTAKEKWLKSQHAKKLSDEHKRKIGDAQRGKLNHRYGKKLSVEHKQALSTGAKNYWKNWRKQHEFFTE